MYNYKCFKQNYIFSGNNWQQITHFDNVGNKSEPNDPGRSQLNEITTCTNQMDSTNTKLSWDMTVTGTGQVPALKPQ
jgi:hypothetical protein